MFNVLKANIKRLFKNVYFIGGCILAMLITVGFINNAESFLGPHYRNAEKSAQLISIGVIMFISIFAPIFQNAEYSGGVIRNKVATGVKQSEIYAAHFITQIVASAVIILCWAIGGVIGGVSISSWLIGYIVRLFFSMIAYSSFITFIGMRFKKIITSASLGVLAVQVSFSATIIIFMLVSRTWGTTVGHVLSFIGNGSAIGRWFVNSQLSDPELNISIILSIVISLVMAVIYYAVGSFRINKRDLT